ncbi:MAG: FecR family protein [Tannerella sp.]|nr:FecR family protein [Tannerella sp.]
MDIDFYNALRKFINGDADVNETKRILSWIGESPDNKREYIEFRKLNDLQLWNFESGVPYTQKGRKVRKLCVEILKIAAVFMLGILGALYVLNNKDPEEKILSQTIRVPAGQKAEMTLSDGTEIWLNSGSTLIYPEKFSTITREVKLDGEAWFKVKKNKDRRFTVKTSQYDLHVLGTEFNVRAYPQDSLISTALVEGRIGLQVHGEKQTVYMSPGQLAVFDVRNNRLEVANKNLTDVALWRNNEIKLNNLSAQNLCSKLEAWYGLQVKTVNQPRENHLYNLTIRNESIEELMELIHKVTPIKYQINGKEVSIEYIK